MYCMNIAWPCLANINAYQVSVMWITDETKLNRIIQHLLVNPMLLEALSK